MAKATTIKEAIKRFEDMKTVTAAEQDKVLVHESVFTAETLNQDVEWARHWLMYINQLHEL